MTSTLTSPPADVALATSGARHAGQITRPAAQARKVFDLGLSRSEDLTRWAWMVAVAGSFLAVGIAGLWADLGPEPRLLSLEKQQQEIAAAGGEAMLMADLAAEPEAAETEVSEVLPQEVLEVPPPVEVVPEALDLPEMAEALVHDDLFVVPAAPKLEEALRPVDPAPPKPQTKPAPRSSAPTRSVARSSTTGRSGMGQGTGGGSGGVGAGTSGQGTFVIPRPTYPSSLRSLGVQGTVRLQVTVGTSGRATSVSIVGTSGNSSLDQYAASWVRRNGKAPPGEVRTFIAPLSFVLR